jgi:hypothetical protein
VTEKRMLIVSDELVRRIDENRDNMSRADFIEFLIESRLGQDSTEQHYVTKGELQEFEQGIKGLLQSFLEFFVSYGLELGKQPIGGKIEELDQKLGGLGGTFVVRKQGKNAGKSAEVSAVG